MTKSKGKNMVQITENSNVENFENGSEKKVKLMPKNANASYGNGMLSRVKAKDGTFDLTCLSEKELKECRELAVRLKDNDISSVINYGSDVQKSMNNYSKTLLSNATKSKLGDETSTILQELLHEVNRIDLGDLKAPGAIETFLRKIPIIRNIFTSIEEYTEKITDIEGAVEKIEDKIRASKIVAERDNSVLELKFSNINKQMDILERLIVAAKIKQDEVRKEIESFNGNENGYDSLKYEDLIEFYKAIDKRGTDMIVWHQSFNQSLRLIRKIQRANIATVTNAESILDNTMPMLRDQLSDALILYNTEQSAKAHIAVSDSLDKIMKSNAERAKDVILQVDRLNEKTTISFETIQKRQQILCELVEEKKKIWEEGRLKRQEIERRISEMNDELEKAVIGSYSPSSNDNIEDFHDYIREIE